MNVDKIFIKNLQVETVIGIYDWEKKIRQTISLDIEMATDIRKAADSDDIADTVNYKSLSKRLVAYISASRFELVETLAEKVAEIILNEFEVKDVRIVLHKPGALSDADDVGIIINRQRNC